MSNLAAESFGECCFWLMLGLFTTVPSVAESFAIVECQGHYPCPWCSGQSSWLCFEWETIHVLAAGVTLFFVLSTLLHSCLIRCDSREREPGGWMALSPYCCCFAIVERLKIQLQYERQREAAHWCFYSWRLKMLTRAGFQPQICYSLSFSCLEICPLIDCFLLNNLPAISWLL